ncbi:LysR family transcriptional regulator [Sphingomonas sp.]|uniref:LysR family transcriptional regulator n=1 Tax=Sphingomonas sp. TaxID=28214 RepID=UPI002DD69C24|nr:LysR family transcriptional regulator [Sphingomonas sp.]
MELKQLRYFLAVAEELNFTRAAAKVGIAQPPLSQQILILERQLGKPLFVRTKRKVELTPAGEILVERARRIINLCEEVSEDIAATDGPQIRHLRMGAIYTIISLLAPQLFRACRRDIPALRIDFREMTAPQQFEALRDGAIDIAVIRGMMEGTLFCTRKLFDEPFVAALPDTLAEPGATVTPDWLARQDFIWMTRATNTHYDNLFRLLPVPLNDRLNVVQTTTDMHTMLCLVAAGIGVALVPRATSTTPIKGITYRGIEGDIPHSSVSVYWRREDDDPLLLRVIELIAAIAETMHVADD